MTLKTRRILYIFFILLFLTITPLISLYASGYKIGQEFRIEKTGILILDSKPAGATIYLDDKAQRVFWKKYFNPEESYIQTPAKIKNLLPGEYFVRIEAPGYWPWQKKLKIEPGQSTFAEDVRLFKKDLPTNVVEGSFQEILFQENPNYLFLKNGTNTQLLNLEHESIEKTINVDSLSAPDWNANFNVFSFGEKIYTLNKEEENQKYSSRELGEGFFDFSENDSGLLYFYDGKSINSFDLKNQSISELVKTNDISNFIQKDNFLFYTHQEINSTNLLAWSLNDKLIKKQISLPASEYKFVNKNHKLINLLDTRHSILYLIDPLSPIQPLKDTINNINKFEWIDENILIYANNFEIWIYNLNNLEKTLLTRISEKIDRIIPHPSKNYIIFSTDTKINILELDNREKRNITELISLNKIKDPVMTKNGEVLFFLARIGKQEGLYKLFIQ